MRLLPASSKGTISAKREQREKALASTVFSESLDQVKFTNATATEIVSHIESGEWTATHVTEAFIKQASVAHAATNCLTEIMFDWARQQAKDLDEEFSRTKKLRGPLHGVPTSVKDTFHVEGYDSTIGFSSWSNKPATVHADIVSQLLAAGAVIFVKTNVPQTLFAFECCNPLWGRSTNPWNSNFTCGGSSGGEGALLAMDGSAVGIGSDVGGSLRIPAAYCGIYSLKPSFGRMSLGNSASPVDGFEAVKTVSGPMGRCIEDLELICRLSFGVQGSDQNVAPLAYRDILLPDKLRFGFYHTDNFVKSSPACKRAILETVEALRKQGHECIEIDPDVRKAFEIFVGITSADAYKIMTSHIKPDPKERSLFLVTLGPKLPSPARKVGAWAIEGLLHDPVFAEVVRLAKKKTPGQFVDLVAQRDEFTRTFFKEIWDKNNLDGIVAPVQALPQLAHGGCEKFTTLAAATILYNILDHPAGCLPVTKVDPALDQLTQEWTKGPPVGSVLLETGLYKLKKPFYDPDAAAGMPVGIQVVGRKWEEEKVLAMMRVVDEALGKDRGFGPGALNKMKEKDSNCDNEKAS